jgi:hypothetical protein
LAGVFLLTTPYALLSARTFLHGDENGFGGIFGVRGMTYYNNFPPSLTEPFSVTILAALNPLGLLVFALSLIVAFRSRRPGDLLLLSFIVPFYMMLTYKSSPMLRHILPVLPFIFLLCAGALSTPYFWSWRTGPAGPVLLGAVALTWVGLSASAIERMSRVDTRVQAEQWVKANVGREAIAIPTYAPYRYTPAIDSSNLYLLHDSEQDWSSMVGSENAQYLEKAKPEYLLMVEPEYRVNGRSDDRQNYKYAFTAGLAANRNYLVAKLFREPFRILGVSFYPRFPTEDWNYPSPEILIYKRK